ncbi:MAG: alpha/beta hydrolase [Candidatus Woesearchaeota archaeon]
MDPSNQFNRKSVYVQDSKIVYYTKGKSSKAVLFCHGDCQNHTAGLPIIDTFPEDYMCISIDFPGHGLSEEISGRTLDMEADLVHKILDAEGVDNAVLLGHSKGCMPLLGFASDHPEYVDSMVLLNPFFMEPARVMWYLPARYMIRQYLKGAQGKYSGKSGDFHVYGTESSEEAIKYVGLRDTPLETILTNFDLCTGYDIRSKVSAFNFPVLVLHSNQDFLSRRMLRHARKVTGQMPNSQFRQLDTTHNLHILSKNIVVDEIKKNSDFLGI